MKFGLFNIPDAVARLIFSRLNENDLARSSVVSREFHRIAEDNTIWENHFKIRFEHLEWFNLINDLYKKHNINYKSIFNKLSYINQSKKHIRSMWQLVLLSENANLISAYFENNKNEELFSDATYERFHSTSALHYCALLGNNYLVKYFLDHKISVNILNAKGETPLHSACLKGRLSTLQLLVTSGATPALLTEDGWNLAHCSALSGKLHTLRYVIETLHIQADVLTNQGQSLLHLAAKSGNAELVKYLIQHLKLKSPEILIFNYTLG